MAPIYVNGLGVLNPQVVRKERGGEINLAGDARIEHSLESFAVGVSPSKVRRCPRYGKMAVAAVAQLLSDAGRVNFSQDDTGTILTTGYGPVASNIEFADSVVAGLPSLCSPTTFSYTVPNSCLGQVCIAFGFKGFSTMLLGGDPLEFAALALAGGRAESIICGAVEEYNGTIAEDFRAQKILNADLLSEAAVMLLCERKAGRNCYGKVINFASMALSAYPYVERLAAQEVAAELEQVLSAISQDKKIEIVLTTANGSYFDALEAKALRNVLGLAAHCLAPKAYLGETLGASYLLNVAYGLLLLRQEKSLERLLVTGLDVVGNYLATIIERE